jgi:hypothetical protein
MSFIPKISITEIPKTASSLKISDVTGVYPADQTGYEQVSGVLPDGPTDWATKIVTIQRLGSTPSQVLFVPDADKSEPEGTLNYTFQDGVHLVTQYFSKQIPLAYSLNAGKTVLTKADNTPWIDPLGLLDGVYALQWVTSGGLPINTSGFSKIISITDTEITLDKELTGATNNAALFIFYKVTKNVLILNQGESQLLSDIGDMSLTALKANGCNSETTSELFNRVLLKTAAQIAFNCGNYSKAHDAALLLAQSSQTSNCSSCD